MPKNLQTQEKSKLNPIPVSRYYEVIKDGKVYFYTDRRPRLISNNIFEIKSIGGFHYVDLDNGFSINAMS
jgi:hypothetical protein